MRMIRLVPFVVFFLLLGGQATFVESVYAMCCGCSTCGLPWCSCPGQNGCAWYQCRTAETDNLQTYTPTDSPTMNAKLTRNLDGLMSVRQVSECSRQKFAMRLLGDAAGNLKVEPIGADPRSWYRTAVEVKIAAKRDQ